MKLDNSASIFNMGDTSIRVKQIVDVHKVILRQLDSFMGPGMVWRGNSEANEEFYRLFIDEIVRLEEEEGTELFRDFARARTYVKPALGKMGMRGRTLTNALVKSGLIDTDRRLSTVGRDYLEGSTAAADPVEQLLGLDTDNLVYLRQYLKMRIYSCDGKDFFCNFRFALKFLSKYSDVPQNDFLRVVESVKPGKSEEDLNAIIDGYADVALGKRTFESYYTDVFSLSLRSRDEFREAREMFDRRDFSDESFIRVFHNRDSSDISLLYRDFVMALIALKEEGSSEAFERIKKLSRDARIKKAFGENRLPFAFRRKETAEEFLEANADSPLLGENDYDIYMTFVFSKHNDLVREYSDMCRRTFRITGLVSFERGLVNLNSKWIIKPLIEMLGDRFNMSGSGDFREYEEDPESPWFMDISTTEILGLTSEMTDELIEKTGAALGVGDISALAASVEAMREEEFRTFVEDRFSRERTVDILRAISARDDEAVFRMVTDNATIPTIYEYMLTIAWYHLSDKKDFSLHRSFGVALDGSRLPLTHRGGGAGDIEILAKGYSLLIEATLMEPGTQKRGELEPVIRHSVNFAIDCRERDGRTQTLFVANRLDDNVINIFRSVCFVQLNGPAGRESVTGLDIFSVTTEEIIRMLERSTAGEKLLDTAANMLGREPELIENGWRKPVMERVLGLS